MNTSAEQTASIKKSMQEEGLAKDETIRELVCALRAQEAADRAVPNGPDSQGYENWQRLEDRATALRQAALRKAGAL